MAIRMNTRWHTEKARSLEELAGALGFIIWKISADQLLELENAGFMTYSNKDRLYVMAEFLAYLLQCTDRLVAEQQMTDADRQVFIAALAEHLVQSFTGNQAELYGPADYRPAFVKFLNHRIDEYSGLGFAASEAKTDFLRHFGEQVETILGGPQKHWVCQHVMEAYAPAALKSLRKALRELVEQ